MNVTELVIVLTGTDDFAHCVWFSRFPNTGHWDNRDQFWESFSFHFSGSGDARDVWQESAGKLTINSKSTFHWLNILLNWVLAFYLHPAHCSEECSSWAHFWTRGYFVGLGRTLWIFSILPVLARIRCIKSHDIISGMTLSSGCEEWHSPVAFIVC